MPDRSNYEIWLIDWLDGKLTERQVMEFTAFLDSNPDIKEEADALSGSCLAPENCTFNQKDNLKKTAAELTSSQIELLSVAYLENDLSPEQLTDLKDSLYHNQNRTQLFDSVQKIKLVPIHNKYKYKNQLKKQVRAGTKRQFYLLGLSVAATIALLIIGSIFVPRYLSGRLDLASENLISRSVDIKPFIVRTRTFYANQEISLFSHSKNIVLEKPTQINAAGDTAVISGLSVVPDSLPLRRGLLNYAISSIPVIAVVDLEIEIPFDYLVISYILPPEPMYDYERSRLRKFIARTFRERVLREENVNESPLKPYEIARAGVDGLNKLLGWEMAIVETNDKAGDLKSVYFSSRVLKFNAPVRKSEPY